jgi:serine/threonine protein kinase/tetratricopeptide (TPR) repeat protein
MAVKCPKCQTDNPETQKFCGECGTQLPSLKDIEVTETLETPMDELTRGTTFAGRYEIIEELGKGGMGAVYRVEDTKIGQDIALKLIKPEIASNKKTIERFRNELKTTRMISHRNVCRMFDLGDAEGTYFITMEYIQGEDLRSFIKRARRLDTGTVIAVAKQVCEGLAEAHRLGVVHRDLKSSNIMIDKEGNARIMDFGIARSLEAKGITGAGVMIGTPEFMSPEQVEGKEVDQRSDIYSLGVILYEMVTGRVPFKGDTPFVIGMKHKGEMPQNPKELNTQISDGLNRVILRCLEKEKDKRYQSAEELSSELKKIEEEIPSTERIMPKRKPVTTKEITVTLGLKRTLIPALIVIAVAIVGIAVWQLLFKKESPPELSGKPRIAVLPFEDLSPQKDQEYFCDGLAEELINALTHVKGLDVVARYSSFSFKDQDMDISEISKALNVETILKGSVLKSGNKLRVISNLIDSDGSQLWSEKYDRDMEEIFAIHDEISQSIVNKLKVNLLGEEQAAIQKRPTEDMQAYDLYLKGIFYKNKVNPDDLKKGLEYLQKATERDPNFALAYVEIGNIYANFAFLGKLPPNEVYPKAKAALKKAMEIDDSLGEAHTLAANISTWHDWDWPAAEKGYKRAISLNPSLESAHSTYAMHLYTQGRYDEAITEIKLAQQLNPLNAEPYAWAGITNLSAGRQEEAMEQVQKAMEINPNSPIVLFFAGYTWAINGMFQEAIDAIQKSYELSGGTFQWAHCGLGAIYAIAGQKDKTEEVLQELLRDRREGYVPCMSIANHYRYLGNEEKALEWLENAYEERDALLVFVKVFPGFDFFRTHPRGKVILKKMGLED